MKDKKRTYLIAFVFLCCSLIFLFASLVYNEYLLSFFDPNPPFDIYVKKAIRYTELYYFIYSCLFFFLYYLTIKIRFLQSLVSLKYVSEILLSISVFFVIFTIPELAFRPFIKDRYAGIAYNRNSIFVKDNKLGWKLKPGSSGIWGGVKVEINNKGLIGPELNYEKKKGIKRILFIGDSVTFGFKLSSYEKSYPFRCAYYLNNSNKARKYEIINGGVGGYSPWQEYIFLREQGIRYSPDIVVLGFVLNDLTEKFDLKRFGGEGEGYQLMSGVSPYRRFIDRYIRGFNFFATKMYTRFSFGTNVEKEAIFKEFFNVKSVLLFPERNTSRYTKEVTMNSLKDISIFLKKHKIPFIIILFPYAFQFELNENDILSFANEVGIKVKPKKYLDNNFSISKLILDFSIKNDIIFIDIFPVMKREAINNPALEFFIDENHLNEKGSDLVGRIIAERIMIIK